MGLSLKTRLTRNYVSHSVTHNSNNNNIITNNIVELLLPGGASTWEC